MRGSDPRSGELAAFTIQGVVATEIPEPGSLVLFGSAVAALGLVRRRRLTKCARLTPFGPRFGNVRNNAAALLDEISLAA